MTSLHLGGGAPQSKGDRRWNNQEGEPVAKSRTIQHLRLLAGENTIWVLRNTALPTVNRCTFCKSWHLEMNCFTGCIRAGPPPVDSSQQDSSGDPGSGTTWCPCG